MSKRRSKSFGTKRIRANSLRAREITRFIDERRARSACIDRSFATKEGDCGSGDGEPYRKEPGSPEE